jgi:NADPH:quinone reductase-like Zn-dependent oxidoreductase
MLLSRFVKSLRPLASEPNQADLVFLTRLIETDNVTPVIGKTYPLSQVPDAIGYLKAGHARGKIVIAV